MGSSFLPSELNVAYLYAKLENAESINKDRKQSWDLYYKELANNEMFAVPVLPSKNVIHNDHIYYIKTKNLSERDNLISFLKIKRSFRDFPLYTLTFLSCG